MRDSEVIAGVLRWFEDERHWTKGKMVQLDPDNPGNRSTCLLGGIEYAQWGYLDLRWVTPCHDGEEGDVARYTPLHFRMAAVIREQFPDRVQGDGWEISDFNDDNATTIEEVRAVCEKTLAALREEEG